MRKKNVNSDHQFHDACCEEECVRSECFLRLLAIRSDYRCAERARLFPSQVHVARLIVPRGAVMFVEQRQQLKSMFTLFPRHCVPWPFSIDAADLMA